MATRKERYPDIYPANVDVTEVHHLFTVGRKTRWKPRKTGPPSHMLWLQKWSLLALHIHVGLSLTLEATWKPKQLVVELLKEELEEVHVTDWREACSSMPTKRKWSRENFILQVLTHILLQNNNLEMSGKFFFTYSSQSHRLTTSNRTRWSLG